MSTDEIIQHFTTIADTYDEAVFRDRDYIAFEKIPAWIIDQGLPKQGHILDLGCGTGLSARPFFAAGYGVTGVDITPKMIEQCRVLPFRNLVCQRLEQPLPFADNSYHAVVVLGVMEFITAVDFMLAEMARVLVKGGLVGITFPLKLDDAVAAKLGIATYPLEEIRRLCARAGFTTLRTETFQGFIYEGETVTYLGLLLESFRNEEFTSTPSLGK